ncbi:hypothetical protein BJ508DRAFT_165620 [Ascobolus immersus RN42]|uniref:Uncharacterized protein n=1 Tax=Ascobolus immersus RN42 TaxID=1160509 RepID=A0A3N4HUV2_ASCIM|nr:hypothetical protein BJ508DRAFT_165620 [Ascobolus immersus RN42]
MSSTQSLVFWVWVCILFLRALCFCFTITVHGVGVGFGFTPFLERIKAGYHSNSCRGSELLGLHML